MAGRAAFNQAPGGVDAAVPPREHVLGGFTLVLCPGEQMVFVDQCAEGSQ